MAHAARDEARALQETVERMKAKTEMERKTIVDLRIDVQASKEQ